MKSPQGGRLFESLRRMASQPDAPEVRDAELLGRFVQARDEAAFEAIVRRHGPMVLAVCRRRLGNYADAEDAFQAVFLVLARDAPRIGNRESLPGWLFRVAYLVALRMMGKNARRRSMPLPELVGGGDHADALVREEMRSILEEEVNALTDRFRSPVVLCYLEGRSNSEAAALLGCPKGTIDSRLATARKRLLGRLLRRGVAFPAAFGVGGLLLCEEFAGAAFNELVSKTVPAAVQLAMAGSAVGMVPNHISTLVNGVTSTMSLSKQHMAAVLTVALTMLGGGVGLYYATAGGKDPQAEHVKERPAAPKAKEKEPVRVEAEAKLETVRSKTAKEVQALLQKPSHLDQPVNNVPLKDLLESLSDRFEVPIRIDSTAFARMKVPGAMAMYDQPVSLPIVRGMSLGDALHEALAQVSPAGPEAAGSGRVVTYRVRDGQILIVPAYIPPYPLASTGGVGGGDPGMSVLPTDEIGAQIEGEPVSVSVEEKPFSEVLQELHRVTGANIVLDNRQKEKAREVVTATLNDVRLLTALRILGDMCDLKPVELNGVYYVTSRQNAERLQKEINRERFGEPPPPQPVFGGSGLGGPLPVPMTDPSPEKKTKQE
jgi:RNA polymerase sigma factor (sigma-70 family)